MATISHFIHLYRNAERQFTELRRVGLPPDHWLYLLKVFRSMLVTVAREGLADSMGSETVHSLRDDHVDVWDAEGGDRIYRLHWRWTLFSPLKSVFPTAFGLVATNTSERAFAWHWEQLPQDFHSRSFLDVDDAGQSNFAAQWRSRPNAAMSARGVALVNEQRNRVYIKQY